MQNSLLDRIFPASSPLLPRHERRSSRSPFFSTSPPARSTGSPSASSSTILRPNPVTASLSHHSGPLLTIDRAAKSLQSTAQSLIDAQSEGLLAGFTSSNGPDDIPNGSLTPTPTMSSTTTPRKPTTIPIRQPTQKKISLRGARRGLSRSMHELAALKQEEESILETQLQEREDALNQVEAFMSKREAMQSEITSISSEKDAQSEGNLRAEANELHAKIRELENQLFEMKARHRYLIDKAQQLESSVQSKLSSYNASLEILDQDIKQYLARPPTIQPSFGIARNAVNGSVGDPGSFYALHPQRRTLQMALDYWREEKEHIKHRKEAVEYEKTALEHGGQVWHEVVTDIQSFEADLKGQMQKLSMGSNSHREQDEGMAALLSRMDKIMGLLEQRLAEAEEKDWNLLICCMGAELEAFRQGREMLMDASVFQNIHLTEGRHNGLLDDSKDVAATAAPDSLVHASFPNHPEVNAQAEVDVTSDYGHGTGSAISANPKLAADGKGRCVTNKLELLPELARPDPDSEDDDPGPDFLISHT